MAKDFTEAVEKAFRDELADKGAMVTGFISLVTYIDKDGESCWSIVKGKDQSSTSSVGMAEILRMHSRDLVKDLWRKNA